MTAPHSSYEDLAAQRRGSGEYREGYAEARCAYLIGRAVRERRLALWLSQTELASRAGMTQPAKRIWRIAHAEVRALSRHILMRRPACSLVVLRSYVYATLSGSSAVMDAWRRS